jgi:signal transduction histidine kinase
VNSKGKSCVRHQWKILIEPWRAILLTGFAVIFAVLAVERGPDGDTHQSILTALGNLDLYHASLQRDVLQARSGLLRNYDPLVDSIVGLHENVATLKDLISRAGVNDTTLEAHFDGLVASIDQDEIQVEEFKTRNALLQNSLRIFSQMLNVLYDSPYQETQRALAGANDLGNLMMQFSAQASPPLVSQVRGRFAGLTASGAGSVPEVRALVTHGSMVLATSPAVDESVLAIQASDGALRTRRLQQDYLQEFVALTERASWSRLFLGTISLLLCISVSILVYRLRDHARRLTQRLKFEGVISQAKDRLAIASPEECSAAVESAVDLVAYFFSTSNWTLVVMSREKGEERLRYAGASGTSSAYEHVRPLFLNHLRVADLSDVKKHDRFFYRNLSTEGAEQPFGSAVAGGIALSSESGDDTTLLFVLSYSEQMPAFGEEEKALFHSAIETLAQSLTIQESRREKRTLEARLEHAQRLEAIGTLAGGIAHEFNNILGAILGYGEMALQRLRQPSAITHCVEEIVSAGERAKQVVDQILTFSRKRERISQPFDAVEAIADILPLLRASLKEDFNLVCDVPDEPLVVLGNPISLQQIAMNLCRNARDATGSGGSADIRLRAVEVFARRDLSHGHLRPGSYVLLGVHDNGSGISDALLPHIFEPFFTTKANSGGTGLGLATVYGNTTDLGGQIDVRSKPGSGTSFDIYFPQNDGPAIPLAHFFRESETPLGEGQTVMLLDKDRPTLMTNEEKIAALGYEAIGFSAVEDIIEAVEANGPPDLMLLDVSSLDGDITAEAIARRFRGIPYLLITDQDRAGIPSNVRLKLSDVLTKPLNSKNIATAIYRRIYRRAG